MKAYLATFGCRANHYDTERVRAMLIASGASIVDAPSDADVAVFNSCAVTADAEADVRQAVRRAARSAPALRTVVMGCAAARDDGTLGALPSVASVIAGADLEAVASELGIAPRIGAPGRQTGTRALLRIQDGCDEHCTFCATTLARGASRSRPADELIDEARRLAEHHPEIVITGTHIGAYGADGGSSLGQLVERLVCEVPDARFRLSSVEATEVDDRLRELLVWSGGVLAPYLHAPLQSGSDAVLRRMGRHWYTAAAYARAIERIVRDAPVFGLGADVIAGFPGERDDDHAATMSLAASLPFTALHVFPYSARPGTAAPRLGVPVARHIVARRARDLRALGARLASAYRRRRDRGVADIVVIGSAGHRTALTEDYLSVTPTDPNLPRGAHLRATLELRGDGVMVARPDEL